MALAGTTAQPPRRLLAIGPSPHTDSGARVSYELLLRHLLAQPGLVVTHYDMPVHRPLYRVDGTPGPLRHGATLRVWLRALRQLPRHDAVLLFGTPDFCFTYGLAFILAAAFLRRHCAVRLSGGRARFLGRRLPAFARSLCLAAARPVAVISTQTECAREDLPKSLRAKLMPVRGYRPSAVAAPPQPECRRHDKVRLAFVSRAYAEKGEQVLRAAFTQLRNSAGGVAAQIELHIYGWPLPGERGIDAVPTTLHGHLPNERLCTALASNDVLLFPSLYPFEGHPGTILEAFMAGVPVIATDWPGPREIVEHGVNGLIVPSGDAEALAAAVQRFATDPALRERLAAGAAACARNFDQAVVLPELAATLGLVPEADGAERARRVSARALR